MLSQEIREDFERLDIGVANPILLLFATLFFGLKTAFGIVKRHAPILVGLTFSALAVAVPAMTQAQNQIGGHLGYDFDSDEIFIGPNAVFETPFTLGDQQLLVNPEFSYYFVDEVPGEDSSFWLLNVCALYPLMVDFADAYLGAGLSISHFSYSFDRARFDNSGSDTDVGLDGKVGASFGQGNVKPFGEFGFIISDNSWVYAQVGARYTL